MSDMPPRRLCYGAAMTKLFEHAVDVARGLPPEVQDDLARVLLELAGEDQPVVELTPAEEASFQGSLAQADRGEFATHEEVRAVWAKYGL
jgi:hypothetical protein